MPDVINGIFESCGGFFILFSVVKLFQEKLVRGISWAHAAFFTTWGWWNLFFYAAEGLWWSWAGGIALVLVNTFWLGQLVYYTWREKRGESWIFQFGWGIDKIEDGINTRKPQK